MGPFMGLNSPSAPLVIWRVKVTVAQAEYAANKVGLC